MGKKTVHLLDLPDEIFLIIIKKLLAIDVLYSLFGINKRLDRIARSIVHSKFLDFSIISADAQFCAVDDTVLDRFCFEILPEIYQNLKVLIFDQLCMERILLACQYPNLRVINIINYQPSIVSGYLTGMSCFSISNLMDDVYIFRKITDYSLISRADHAHYYYEQENTSIE
jgi:hypothetical protein